MRCTCSLGARPNPVTAIFTSFGSAVNKDEMRRQRLQLYQLPDYIPNKNKSNDYGFDRVFARQVEALGRMGDVAIGISTRFAACTLRTATSEPWSLPITFAESEVSSSFCVS